MDTLSPRVPVTGPETTVLSLPFHRTLLRALRKRSIELRTLHFRRNTEKLALPRRSCSPPRAHDALSRYNGGDVSLFKSQTKYQSLCVTWLKKKKKERQRKKIGLDVRFSPVVKTISLYPSLLSMLLFAHDTSKDALPCALNVR